MGRTSGRREKRELGLARVRRGAGPAWGSAGPGRLGLARDLVWVSREGWAGPGLSLGPGKRFGLGFLGRALGLSFGFPFLFLHLFPISISNSTSSQMNSNLNLNSLKHSNN